MHGKETCGTEGAKHVLKIPYGKTYQLKPLKFEGPCKADRVKIQILGNIEAPSNLSDWNECQSGCWLCFSNVSNLAVVGTGEINGHGYLWWRNKAAQAIDNTKVTNYEGCNAPMAIHFDQCDNLQLSGFASIDSPRNHIRMHRCNDVYISNIHITAPEDSPNTDGIAISSTSHVKVLDSVIETGDDCISIKGGSFFINISSVACGPGHGTSVGSLGEHGAHDMVENVHVQNCNFTRAQNGARIKTWQGGFGYARAITFDQITLSETKNPIIINQNCVAGDNVRGVKVSDITFSGFQGTSASEQALTLNCCTLRCTNIVMDHVC